MHYFSNLFDKVLYQILLAFIWQSTLSNKFEKYCIQLSFIIRIYHDARSSECQIHKNIVKWADFVNDFLLYYRRYFFVW
jgi:hypothetical protein